METAQLVSQMTRGLYLSLVFSLPVILVTGVVGILFALVQALTQIQDQSLAFAVKLVTVAAVLAFSFQWMGSELYQYTLGLLEAVQYTGRRG
ncbi:type III secretion system export apparatus subunit SctS [Variovorax saccharolyticus]|uniref:type III secretion system export apparatus subunit SctS n=1 Tax=Variovorax saccharolyticus TaxID=3053516 RepID=UPI00257565EA|nr:type III secretion system export apparatus subunit SctS [Variovorax sp. J31P216]MDM0030166.1 type III secretion system export apparatus subunit SctS [Variovorax sp. J31P216]